IKMDVEGFELDIIRGAQHILETQSPVIFAELATKAEFKNFKQAVAQFGYATDMVNYAATPTYLFQKASVPVGTKAKQSAKRLYWGVKDKLTK
ncbi:MAG: FkbM family methyltransferase, partial [Candidatus Poseidoniales archaeon]